MVVELPFLQLEPHRGRFALGNQTFKYNNARNREAKVMRSKFKSQNFTTPVSTKLKAEPQKV